MPLRIILASTFPKLSYYIYNHCLWKKKQYKQYTEEEKTTPEYYLIGSNIQK